MSIALKIKEFINERGTCFFLDLFLFMRTTFFQESVSAICLNLEIGR